MQPAILVLCAVSALSGATELASSWVSPEGFGPRNHASSLAELPNGRLLVCWYSGSRETAPDTRIACSDSRDGGATWSTPRTAVEAGESAITAWKSNKFVGNAALGIDGDGRIWMFYAAVTIFGWSASHVDYKVSEDEGRTWSDSRRLIAGFGNLPKNKPIRLGPHEFFLPLSRERGVAYGYGCRVRVANGVVVRNSCFNVPGSGHGQPAFVRLSQAYVAAYMRAKRGRRVYFAVFDLETERWSDAVQLDVPNPNSGLDAAVGPNSSVLLVHNDSQTARRPLTVALSVDGLRFRKLFDLENDAANESSYPAIVRSASGDYLITYTHSDQARIKFVRVPASRVRGGGKEDGGLQGLQGDVRP